MLNVLKIEQEQLSLMSIVSMGFNVGHHHCPGFFN
jgi:hypothetical protein